MTQLLINRGEGLSIPTDLALQKCCWKERMQKDPLEWKFSYQLSLQDGNITIFHDARSRGSESADRVATINTESKEINEVDTIMDGIKENSDSSVEELRATTVALTDLLIKLKREHEQAKAERKQANDDLKRLRIAFKVLVDQTLSQQTLDEVEKLLQE